MKLINNLKEKIIDKSFKNQIGQDDYLDKLIQRKLKKYTDFITNTPTVFMQLSQSIGSTFS